MSDWPLDDSQLVIAVIQGLVLVVSVMTAFRKARVTRVNSAVTDGSKVDHMLNAGSNPHKAQAVFAAAIKHTPLGDASKEVNRLNGWYDWR